jgi:uncharacterized protein YprB with RNaseH-like and TPR domain
MESLSDKLKAMGVNIGVNRRPTSGRAVPIEAVVEGEIKNTPLGETFLVDLRYASGHAHGNRSLAIRHSMETLAVWAKGPELTSQPLDSIVFLDTETSGLAGGAGTFAFMIGVGRFIEGEFNLVQFFLRDPTEEPAMLAALEAFLSPCYTLVTFNGKSFDLPLLQSRFITNGWETPWRPQVHIDLLHLARRLWRHRLPSRALSDLEHQILAVERTEDEVPGWLVPQIYVDYLRSKDARPLQGVFYHNEIDILTMAVLMDHMAEILEISPDSLEVEVEDIQVLGKIFEDIGLVERAVEFYEHCLAPTDQPAGAAEARKRLSFMRKRAGEYAAAVQLWQAAAEREEIYAFEELAKYYEHQVFDFSTALSWSERALSVLSSDSFPVYDRLFHQQAFEHRKTRLIRRIRNNNT